MADRPTADELIKKLQKEYGEKVVGRGLEPEDKGRLATGITAFDLSSGGGIPYGLVSLVYGAESSGKTNFALRCLARFQEKHPDQTAVFIDVENRIDSSWAQKLGVDTKRWVLVRPDFAEQAVDLIEGLLLTSDVGFLVLDSIAAMISAAEVKRSAEVANVGGSGLVVGKLVRKTTMALNQAYKDDRYPIVMWINQTRMKVGLVFGDPTTQPGGAAIRFQSSMTVRMWGKNIVDPSVNKTMPVRKLTKGVIEKWSAHIVNPKFEYEMAMIPHDGKEIGECDDWSVISGYLEDAGALGKTDDKPPQWQLMGTEYPTLKAIKADYAADPTIKQGCMDYVMEYLVKNPNAVKDISADE